MLRSLLPNEKLLRHSTAVAEVAAYLADAMVLRGVDIDALAVETAALLHDMDKMLPEDDPLKALGHGAAGAEWLRQRGYPELAPAVAAHPVMELGYATTYHGWADRAGLAGRVVTYADKRARQDLITLDDRFARWHENYPDSPKLDEAHARAHVLEIEICGLAGITPDEVGRHGLGRRGTRCRGLTWPTSGARTRGRSSAAGRDFRAGLEQAAGQPFDIWRTSGEEDEASAEVTAGKRRDRVIDGVAEHLATSPMFSAGTIVVVRQPGSLLRETAARERLLRSWPRSRPAMPSSSWSCSRRAAAVQHNRAHCATRSRPRAARSRTSLPCRAIAWRAGSTTRATELGITLAPGAAGCSPSVSVPTCASPTSIGAE